MNAYYPDIKHAATWTALTKPKVTIPPCGIPHVQHLATVQSRKFTVKHLSISPAQLHEINDFFNDNHTQEFNWKWHGDSTLAAGTYVCQFEAMPVSLPRNNCNQSFDVTVSFLAYEEVIL